MLKDIYPEYQDSVGFYAVNVDTGEGLDSLIRHGDEEGHLWPVAQAPAAMLPQYDARHVPTKLAIDGNGVIVFRGGYSVESAEAWLQVFQELSGA